MHKTTLEQWALLEKVIELGSFTRAAGETNHSQSSVSHSLALPQEHLGVMLLTLSGRWTVLIPASELLLNQVKSLLQVFAHIEAHAVTLRNGARTHLDLMIDSIFPRQRLFAILRQLQQCYPQTQVRLTGVLENVDDESAARTEVNVMVLTHRQDITGRGEWLMNIDFIAVAHRDHPLTMLDGPLEDSMLAPWPPVRTVDQIGDDQATRDAWTLSIIDAAIDAAMYQVRFGQLPKERIRPRLDQDVLKRLSLNRGTRCAMPLHLIVRWDLIPIGEQVATLLGLLRAPREAQAMFIACV